MQTPSQEKRIDVFFDCEAGVYVATSESLEGFTVEAKTLEELLLESFEAVEMLCGKEVWGQGRVLFFFDPLSLQLR